MPNEAPPARGSLPASSLAGEARHGTLTVVDALQAIVHTELLCARALWAPRLVDAVAHAFDETVEWLGDDLDDANGALEACDRAADSGARTAALLSVSALANARTALRRLVERRRPVVIHAVVTPRGRDATPTSYADVHAIADLGAGVLLARDAQDASDLVIIAHRAAEDAEAPIVVVHDGYPASYARDRVILPDAPLVRAALEPAPPPLASSTEESLPGHRRAAARVPFALASAMRTFERLSGRKTDALDAHHTAQAEIAIVAAGAIAETARAVVEHARAQTPGLAVGLVQIVSLRPFPGAQLVKALARVRSIAVLDRIDTPLAQSNPLALEVKAAFADALTWTPGYPGIGRIPEIFSGSVDPAAREATPADLFAVLENLALGEQGQRVFHLGGVHPRGHHLTPGADRAVHPDEAFALRWHADPALLVHLLGDLYRAHVRATPRAHGPRDAYDVVVSPSPVRAHHGAHVLDVIALDSKSELDPQLLDALREGGALILLGGAADAALAKLPSAARAVLRARNGRVFVAPEVTRIDAALLGALLRARPPRGFDRARTIVDAERSLRAASPPLREAEVRAMVEATVRAIDTVVELRP